MPATKSNDQQLEVRDLPVATDQGRWAGAGIGRVRVGQRIHSKNASDLLSSKKPHETLLSTKLWPGSGGGCGSTLRARGRARLDKRCGFVWGRVSGAGCRGYACPVRVGDVFRGMRVRVAVPGLQ